MPARTQSRDAIALLREDHATARRLFRDYRATSERAYATKRRVADHVIRELAVHAGVEETVFYPRLRVQAPEILDEVLESLEEHHVLKLLTRELESLDPRDERFDAKMQVLSENTLHHMREEEQEMFPRVRRTFSRADLLAMGEDIVAARSVVPTRPHPHAADEPPDNITAAMVAAPLDEFVTTVKGAVRRAVHV